MRHLKFINESLSTDDLSKDNFYSLLDRNCKQFSNYGEYLQNNLIFRKQEYVGDYVFCNPSLSTTNRIAPYSMTNFHNLLVSNLESWKDWPRRNKSLICASSYRALSHGASSARRPVDYIIIPYDTTKIATGDRGDFWNCFQTLPNDEDFTEDDLDRPSLAWWASSLISILSGGKKVIHNEVLNRDWNELKKFLERRNVSQYIIDKYFTNDNEVMWDDSLNLLDNINIILNPSINNFKLLNTKETMGYYSTLDEEEGEAAESWFEGPCLMIRYDLSNDLELNINNKI